MHGAGSIIRIRPRRRARLDDQSDPLRYSRRARARGSRPLDRIDSSLAILRDTNDTHCTR